MTARPWSCRPRLRSSGSSLSAKETISACRPSCAACWGYNGQVPGPTIEAVEGDRIRILVTNKLPAATSVHWHGVRVPNGMDGVSGLTQPMIAPGETFQYEFTLRQHGTQMYHPHFDEMTQIGMGMMGFFVIHPRDPDYMAMGKNGMGDMMQMGAPRNSIPMLGGEGPHGAIDMGGMFTILKVREGISSYEDPGWYAHPPGSQARAVKGKES